MRWMHIATPKTSGRKLNNNLEVIKMIKNNIEVIDLQGQLERLVDNYRKLRKKDGQGKLITWSNHLLYEMYPRLIEDQRKDIDIRGRRAIGTNRRAEKMKPRYFYTVFNLFSNISIIVVPYLRGNNSGVLYIK